MAEDFEVVNNLNLKGNHVKNGGFEVVTSLSTTNNFVGRQVTYQGRNYIWDGSAWKCDSDYLDIGGRNYIPNSKIKTLDGWGSYYSILSIEQNTLKLVGNGTYVATYINLTENLEIDKEVTLCFDFKNNKANNTTLYFWVNGNGGSTINIPGNSGWVRFNETFIPAHYSGQQIFGTIYIGSYGDSDFQIRNVKLEKGNIATDWTPAPEDKADENQTINFDTSNIEPTQTGTVTKTSTWLWQYLTQSVNYSWLKLKTWVGGLFSEGSATINNNYLPKIDDVNKKLVKSNINDNGSRISLDKPLRVNSKTFYNVAQRTSLTSIETGTILIEMPFGWTSNMGTYEIDIYNYDTQTKSKIIVSGYNFDGGVWLNTSLQIIGSLPSNVVRLGYNTNTSKCCILIGTTTTLWSYPQVYVSKVTQGFYDTADWSAGWNISIIDAAYESANITNIIQPTANVGMMLDGKNLTQQIADNDLRYLGLTDKAADSDKLEGLNSTDFAQLENGKIKASNLPDYLLGQVLYGGSINSSQVCTLSSLYKDKFNTTDTTRLLSNLTASSNVGVYFIASGNFLLNGTIDVNVGDWVISDGNSWGKIDNTDAVASVNGYTGVINLHYEDLGDMPIATDVKAGGFKIGYDNILSASPEALPLQIDTGVTSNKDKAFVVLHHTKIKELLGASNSESFNGDDIFVSGLETPSSNFDAILYIGSYRVYGSYSNAPNSVCGTNTGITTSMVGALNVFRSGANNWETIQQLFWVQSGVVEQYQRSYYKNGSDMTWTVWKRLIKCDDYATTSRGGIISEANFGELFRAPDLIQLWNVDILSLAGGTYNLNTLSYIDASIANELELDTGAGNDIIGLTSGRRYRVTYEVHYIKEEGEGAVTIKIENGYGEIYSKTDNILDFEISKTTSFSVIITGTDVITPSIEVSSGLTINIPLHLYQISVEEIKFPYYTPVQ